jgi:hypothetical protein
MPSKEKRAKMTPEQLKEINRKNSIYQKTPKGKKVYKISHWKGRGIICDDWDDFYDNRWITNKNCECCGKEYINQKQKHLDHCHKTGKLRNILCQNCNHLRGHIEKDYKLIMKLITMC